MVLQDFLAKTGNFPGYSRKSKVLLLAYYFRKYEGKIVFTSTDIRQCFTKVPLKCPSHLSKLLYTMAKGKNSPLMKVDNSGKYSLAMPGINEVEVYLTKKVQPEEEINLFLTSVKTHLEKVIFKVSETNQRKFIAEAISCLGEDAKRATIIMMWAGAISHLYDYILSDKKRRLADFNAALGRRPEKYNKLVISDYDGFSDIPESIFIEVTRSAGLISDDVKKILKEKLGIRNTSAHPSGVEVHMTEVHMTKVINFIEDLVDNVITKYKIK